MRAELTRLHGQLRNTFLYVTHDQTEAMTMGERIVVMDKGAIQQVGTPEEVYRSPANRFVAGFIGTPPMNFFPLKVDGRERTAGVRPEHLRLCAAEDAGAVPARVELVEFLGAEKLIYVRVWGDRQLILRAAEDTPAHPGAAVHLRWAEKDLHIF